MVFLSGMISNYPQSGYHGFAFSILHLFLFFLKDMLYCSYHL